MPTSVMFAALSMASAASIWATSPLVSINPMASFIMFLPFLKKDVYYVAAGSRRRRWVRVKRLLPDNRRLADGPALATLGKHGRQLFVRTRNDLHADDFADL